MTFAIDADGEDIEEATDSNDISELQPNATKSESHTDLGRARTRAYVLIDGTQASGSNDDRGHFPNGQFSFSGDYKIQNDSFVLMDFFVNYDAKNKVGTQFLNQAGFQSRVATMFSIFLVRNKTRSLQD